MTAYDLPDLPEGSSVSGVYEEAVAPVTSRLRELLDQATKPRPWRVSVESSDEWWFGTVDANVPGSGMQAVIRYGDKDWYSVAVAGGEEEADAALIVVAVNALPALLDLYDAAKEVIERAPVAPGVSPSLDALQIVLDRLEASGGV